MGDPQIREERCMMNRVDELFNEMIESEKEFLNYFYLNQVYNDSEDGD